MIYFGIDIGKRFHVAGAVDDRGVEVISPFEFDNGAEGFAELLSVMEKVEAAYGGLVVGMEVTGHYWYSCFRHLEIHGLNCICVNPSKTVAMRRIKGREYS